MTTNVSNTAVAHLSFRDGSMPLCGNRRAHIVVAIVRSSNWTKICTRCQSRLNRRKPPKVGG